MWDEITEELVSKLKSLRVWNLTTNYKDIAVRCPICGDSRKHANSCHMYIKLDIGDDEPYTFYCQRCKAKGIVDSSFLKLLKIFDGELNVAIGLKNKSAAKKNKKWKPITRNHLVLPEPQDTKINKIKLKYINDRLGLSMGFEDLSKYKIILNLYDLLDANGVDFLTQNEKFCDTLDKNFIGFVSYDNNYVILRNLSKKNMPDLRYYNYNIFNNYDNTKKFYTIPTKIDILNPKLNVRISEGVFDILGVYHHMEKNPPDNTIFASVNGVGYNLIFMHLAKMGFLDMDISIYSDNDQSVADYKRMKESMKSILSNKIVLNYNKMPNEKDFGVPPDRIKLTRTLI